jgi:ligand-binding sensor domain-containing protein
LALAPLVALSQTSAASQAGPEWNIVKPSTTGIPGEELREMVFDPQGNLWVAGRWTFWQESGVARLSADQVPHAALPGGGFDTGAWEVWSSVHDPIPSAFIDDIVFGAGGVVWLASAGGLTRFEPDAPDPGATFFTYNAANSPLLANGIRSLDMDASGRLWMVNGDANFSPAIFSFDPAANSWRRFDLGEELPWPSTFKLLDEVHVGPSGHVWATHGVLNGLAEFDGHAWTLHQGGAPFGAALEDLAGNVWLTTASQGLWKWNGTSFQNWPTLGGTGTITGLGMDATGLVYVSTWYGPTYRMVGGTTPTVFVNAGALPYHIEPRPNGEVWIGNYGGNGVLGTARHYSADGTLLERIQTFNCGLPDYFVDEIFTDLEGNVWFATGEGGITRMLGSSGQKDAPTKWRNFGNHNDSSEPYPWAGNEPMRCMLPEGQGVIWMAGNGIGRWQEATGTFTGFWNWQNSSLSVDLVNDLARDANGDLWAASDGSGVFRFNGTNWEHHFFSNPYSYGQERILALATDHDGLMWVGAEYGLHTFDGTTWKALHLDGKLPFNAFNVNDIEVGPRRRRLGLHTGVARALQQLELDPLHACQLRPARAVGAERLDPRRRSGRRGELRRLHLPVLGRHQPLRRAGVDQLHPGEFAAHALPGRGRAVRRGRRPVGERHERGSGRARARRLRASLDHLLHREGQLRGLHSSHERGGHAERIRWQWIRGEGGPGAPGQAGSPPLFDRRPRRRPVPRRIPLRLLADREDDIANGGSGRCSALHRHVRLRFQRLRCERRRPGPHRRQPSLDAVLEPRSGSSCRFGAERRIDLRHLSLSAARQQEAPKQKALCLGASCSSGDWDRPFTWNAELAIARIAVIREGFPPLHAHEPKESVQPRGRLRQGAGRIPPGARGQELATQAPGQGARPRTHRDGRRP